MKVWYGLVWYVMLWYGDGYGEVHNRSSRIPTLFHRDVLHCSHCLIAQLLGDSLLCLDNPA